MDRLTRFYWQVTRARSVIAFYSPIARVDSYPGIANCINKKKWISKHVLAKYVCFSIQSERTAGILGAISSIPRATRSIWRTRSPSQSTGSSIFVFYFPERSGTNTVNVERSRLFNSSRRICSRVTGIVTRSLRQPVRTRSPSCITSDSVNPIYFEVEVILHNELIEWCTYRSKWESSFKFLHRLPNSEILRENIILLF